MSFINHLGSESIFFSATTHCDYHKKKFRNVFSEEPVQ